MMIKYRKCLPYLLMGLAFVFGGLAGGNENLMAVGSGFMSLGILFVWEAESTPAAGEGEAVSRSSDQ